MYEYTFDKLLLLFLLSLFWCYVIGSVLYVIFKPEEVPLSKVFKGFESCSWEMLSTEKGLSFHGEEKDYPGWEVRVEFKNSKESYYIRRFGPSLFGKSKAELMSRRRLRMPSEDAKLLDRIINDEEISSRSWKFKDFKEIEAFLAVV